MLSVQGFVQCITVMKSICGEALSLSVRDLCCSDILAFSMKGVGQCVTVMQFMCGEVLVLSMRILCRGDSLSLPV